jgi:CheY-like chemotaxis protein
MDIDMPEMDGYQTTKEIFKFLKSNVKLLQKSKGYRIDISACTAYSMES